MNKTTYLLIVGVLITGLMPLIPTAAAYAENQTLTIHENSRTVCLPMDETQESLNLEPSCATGTLTGIIKTCWATSSDFSSCNVEFTGTLAVGPFVNALFGSDAGNVPKIWDPERPEPKSQTQTITLTEVPRAGGERPADRDAVLQAKLFGLAPSKSETWRPIYVFPADPSWVPAPSGCTGGSGSTSGTSATASMSVQDLGIHETVTIGAPMSTSTAAGGGHAVAVHARTC